MSSSRRATGRWIQTWWPVALMILVITIESTRAFGADNTSGPLRSVYQTLFGHVTNARWEVIHHYIRKTGHFVGYGLVGLSWFRALWMTRPYWSLRADAALALVATAVIASADEFHQSFLPNRTSSPWDVLIDCSGALVLVLAACALNRVREPQQVKRAA